ncbi:PREDICTED: LOW QUALITY PROTEIN: T-complex protein 1 subunit theta-like [Priapulus caudatus]|uniref:LOW QUALITY PROTEIN: T-complex protein 1 subunit theta-like n=1 Tax=Priapulus caudatus TaxID=37621 RepID=A0ABM1F349_PRICU|nr:PREDICTED: LOW QUALITY PROTEIN: T-complex protein 1 subunit theta-like [Priapulus caudatus]
MAMHVPQAPGFARMMKDGAQHFQGLEEAVYRNIAACQELARSTRTAYGPNGMNKMVINHLQKLFVTNDAATILKELEVQHPAAKMLVMASQMQEQEVGDATNWVMIFAGELLANAEELLRVGLSPTEVAAGYNLAAPRRRDPARLLEGVPPTAEEMGPRAARVRRQRSAARASSCSRERMGRSAAVLTARRPRITDNIPMDDVERCIHDGINTFKALSQDPRYLPGAGATEIELARQLTEYADTCPGLEQYAIKKFGEALEVFPKILAENAGVKSTEALSMLYASHQEGKKNSGFNIEGEGAAIMDVAAAGIVDTFLSRHWGLRFATSAAVTVLQVDQIIMAKQAGGPKPKKNEDWDED